MLQHADMQGALTSLAAGLVALERNFWQTHNVQQNRNINQPKCWSVYPFKLRLNTKKISILDQYL
jgi:hypothetical protein